jgi:ribosomal protein L11 methyltransferase
MSLGLNKIWYALDVEIEPPAREAVEYALMEAGAAGTTTYETQITAYFDQTPDRERIRQELFEALRIYQLPSSSVRDMNVREVPDQDWLGEWKKNWQPVEVGRFIVAPPWSELGDTHDRLVIRIEPGMAFGTGTHETTRLCLAAIEKHFTGGSFLDVGTGTGILAIAAALLNADARIEACDVDEAAIEIARENAVANGVAERIEFRVGSIEQVSSADFVCANLTADVILKILPSLVAATCGRLVLSGILETQSETIIDSLGSEVEITQDGEWVAITV